jgi:tRNA A-37 threonylcarbamoyl transferase component Bud32
MIFAGNAYLGRSGSWLRMHVSATAWAAYEITRHRALHGEASAGHLDARTIWTTHLEGESLTSLVGRAFDDETRAMRAAGREIGRAHRQFVDGLAFSHGDLHLSNLLWDSAQNRAWMIDFETPHDANRAAHERHADDIQALLLDVLAKVRDDERTKALAAALVEGYRRERPDADAVLRAASARLHVETGVLSRSLQLVRTRGLKAREAERAFALLLPILA